MQIHGIHMDFIEVPPEAGADYGRWCDSIHDPEVSALPGVAGARRYHAGDDIMPIRVSREGAPPIGDSRHCSAYLLCEDDLAAAGGRIAALTHRLEAEGRLFRPRRVVYSQTFRLMQVHLPKGARLSPEAAPFLVHRGMQIGAGFVRDKKDIPEALEWWANVHYADMLTVPGWLTAMRLEPLGREGQGLLTHFFLLGTAPSEAHAELEKVVYGWRDAGRSPAPRDIYWRTFKGPWSLAAPEPVAVTR
jgi:hypothetical protein